MTSEQYVFAPCLTWGW